jgi:hypothetical protein
MRSLREGKSMEAGVGLFEYVPFDRFVSKDVLQKMESLAADLASGEIKTDISPEKP